MNTKAFRGIGSIAGAAAITTAITITGTTASASTGHSDTGHDRPCFMVRSNWDNAEGPQPTCHTPMWPQASGCDEPVAPRPASFARIADFMP